MPRIAISYRRSDSAPMAGRIFDRLSAHYGEDSVFMDIDDIPFGIDFRNHIREVLLRTDVLIAVIGPDWLGRNDAGAARMQAEKDPVRVEIETAVEHKTAIVPVLIDGAKMPESAELPPTFGNFAYLNALDIASGRDFRLHIERLIAAIDRLATPSAGLASLNSKPDVATAFRKLPTPIWRDAERYFMAPLIVLLVAHYAVVNAFNLDTAYLRLACVVVPFAAGFALFWIGGWGAGIAAALALALGVVAAAAMSVSESLYSGDPMLPQTRFEWLDNFQFAAIVALSLTAGHLVSRLLRSLMRRRLEKS
jgi:TIR domain-containing protein